MAVSPHQTLHRDITSHTSKPPTPSCHVLSTRPPTALDGKCVTPRRPTAVTLSASRATSSTKPPDHASPSAIRRPSNVRGGTMPPKHRALTWAPLATTVSRVKSDRANTWRTGMPPLPLNAHTKTVTLGNMATTTPASPAQPTPSATPLRPVNAPPAQQGTSPVAAWQRVSSVFWPILTHIASIPTHTPHLPSTVIEGK